MPGRIRFHLDEHCDPDIARQLRALGGDVTTTVDAGLLHAGDEDHLAYALATGRVVFTQDRDYLRLNAAGVPHAGIAFCKQQALSLGEVIAFLALMWEIYEPEDMVGRVEFLRSLG
jgi:hypothetical protein